jgi:hypothetical protein
MSGRMRWERARPYRLTESKIKAGTVLPNGAAVPLLPQDDLARRAAMKMRQWIKTLHPRDRRRFAP